MYENIDPRPKAEPVIWGALAAAIINVVVLVTNLDPALQAAFLSVVNVLIVILVRAKVLPDWKA